MVGISWITDLLHSDKYKAGLYKSELDNSREGLNRLVELTKQLDEIEGKVVPKDELLNLITNSLEFSIWAKDLNGRFLYLNDVCARVILRTTVDKALHLTDEDFERDALAPVCMLSDKKVLESLTTRRFIEHARYADRDLWLDAVKSPLFKAGKLIGVVGSGKDITDTLPIEIKDRFKRAGSLELGVGSKYYIGDMDERREDGLVTLLEKDRYVYAK